MNDRTKFEQTFIKEIVLMNMSEQYQDFVEFMKSKVIPKQNANPSHIRLDGREEPVGNRESFGYFKRYGCIWRLNKDTRYETLMLAHKTIENNENDDPFIVKPTREKKNISLKLREDLKEQLNNSDEYLYIYLESKI
ncbi:MAG: hypothetical protein AAFQ80_21880 [Cyanobacteria bacterium J06621_8]